MSKTETENGGENSDIQAVLESLDRDLTEEEKKKLDYWENASFQINGGRKRRISDEELLEEIRRLEEAHETRVTYRMMENEGKFSAWPYKKRFGRFQKAVDTAGCETAPNADLD